VAFPWVDSFARDVGGGLNLISLFREAGAEVLLGDFGWFRDEGSFQFQMNIHTRSFKRQGLGRPQRVPLH
jgi:hypothetical protein